MARFADGRLHAVPGWPQDNYFFGLTVHRDQLFAAVQTGTGHKLWRTDGETTVPVGIGPLPARLVDLASDGNQL